MCSTHTARFGCQPTGVSFGLAHGLAHGPAAGPEHLRGGKCRVSQVFYLALVVMWAANPFNSHTHTYVYNFCTLQLSGYVPTFNCSCACTCMRLIELQYACITVYRYHGSWLTRSGGSSISWFRHGEDVWIPEFHWNQYMLLVICTLFRLLILSRKSAINTTCNKQDYLLYIAYWLPIDCPWCTYVQP